MTERATPDSTRLIGQFITIDRIGALIGAALVVVVNALVVRVAGIWLVLPFLLALIAALTVAERQLAAGRILASLAWVAAGNWLVALVVSILLPFMWPVMVLTVLMPLLLATPHLEMRALVWMTSAGALVGGLVAIIGLVNDDGGVLPDFDDLAELVLVTGSLVGHTVPMALIVWHQKQVQAEALVRSEALNTELRSSEQALADSRRRVVEASDNERSRIERDLHDGAQQRLVAARLQLQMLADAEQPAEPGRLATLAGELGEALAELRELAYGIYPPVLETGGLGEALTEVTRRSPLPIELDLSPVGRHEQAIETAIYFTALEALSNAAKHATDAHVIVRLTERGDAESKQIVLEVIDDGPGFDQAAASDTRGLLNMNDRIRAVGGDFQLESAIGSGTRVTAAVPVG